MGWRRQLVPPPARTTALAARLGLAVTGYLLCGGLVATLLLWQQDRAGEVVTWLDRLGLAVGTALLCAPTFAVSVGILRRRDTARFVGMLIFGAWGSVETVVGALLLSVGQTMPAVFVLVAAAGSLGVVAPLVRQTTADDFAMALRVRAGDVRW